MLLVIFELEETPRIVTLARIEDEPRLVDWLRGDPRVGELLADALAIVQSQHEGATE